MKDEVIFLGIIEDEKYGKIAHFFSNKKGNYFCKVVEKNDVIIYDELSLNIQEEILNKIGEEYEN